MMSSNFAALGAALFGVAGVTWFLGRLNNGPMHCSAEVSLRSRSLSFAGILNDEPRDPRGGRLVRLQPQAGSCGVRGALDRAHTWALFGRAAGTTTVV
jgi:hypothetical protein